VSQRHLQGPEKAGPETEHSQKFCREIKVILDEECSDDAGSTGDTRRQIDHERRQIGEPELLKKVGDMMLNPGRNCLYIIGGFHLVPFWDLSPNVRAADVADRLVHYYFSARNVFTIIGIAGGIRLPFSVILRIIERCVPFTVR
jgi:hypothetical protein